MLYISPLKHHKSLEENFHILPVNRRHFCRYEILSDEEVISIAKNGVLEATEFLVMRYRSLVEQKARAYYLLGADNDDVIQEGMIGLCKAIRDFRIDRLSKFKPFAELCITRQIITAIKTAARHKHSPLNASISFNQSHEDERSENFLIDVIPDHTISLIENNHAQESSSQLLLDQVKNVLSSLEQAVLNAYLSGKTYVEMSEELLCPTKTIDNALQRAKRKLSIIAERKKISNPFKDLEVRNDFFVKS